MTTNDRFIPSRVDSRLRDYPFDLSNGGNDSSYRKICVSEGKFNERILAYHQKPIPNKSPSFDMNDGVKFQRHIQEKPMTVLNAPNMSNNYYYSVLSCSSRNLLGLALSDTVHVYDVTSMKKRNELKSQERSEITSISWSPSGEKYAVGLLGGDIMIRNVETKGTLSGLYKWRRLHRYRSIVYTIDWKDDNILACGHKLGGITQYDNRRKNNSEISNVKKHTCHVCGLKWSPDGRHLASGGNDDKLVIWDVAMMSTPLHVFTSHHTAAVKAISWNPHKTSELISGGGARDCTIKKWDITKDTDKCLIGNVNADKNQVCSLNWSLTTPEFASTHGYNSNNVVLWDGETMEPIKKFESHKGRVLNAALSSTGGILITGSNEELHFWKLFPSKVEPVTSAMGLYGTHSVIR